MQTTYERFNAPWDVFELDIKTKAIRDTGKIYGVQDRDGNRIASHLTKEYATLIALAPEMYAGCHGALGKDAVYQEEGGVK